MRSPFLFFSVHFISPYLAQTGIIVFILLCTGCFIGVRSQESALYPFSPLLIACENCRDFQVDPLGNIYSFDKNNELRKYDKSGNLLYSYSNRQLGSMHSFDVSNPMKVFLFYRDLARIIILDNTLAEIQQFDLESLNLQDASAAAPSNDNQLWVFDKFSLLLMKISQDGKILLKSDPVQMLVAGGSIPDVIAQRDTRVFLNDFDKGLLIFDQYGQFIENTKIMTGQYFAIQNNQCYYLEDGLLKVYLTNERVLETKKPSINTEGIKKVILGEDAAHYMTDEGIFKTDAF